MDPVNGMGKGKYSSIGAVVCPSCCIQSGKRGKGRLLAGGW